MKKIILLFTIGLISLNINAQIGKGKSLTPTLVGVIDGMMGNTIKLEFYPKNDGYNYYVLTVDLVLIPFYANRNEIDYLYNFLMQSPTEMDARRSITVGDYKLNINGIDSAFLIRVFDGNGSNVGFMVVTKNMIKRLFGRL